jgi:Phosphopantetheine adenylyltransferase (EC 2.7.7.3)
MMKLKQSFFTTSEQYSYLSSSLVKEVAKFGGKIDGLIPDYAIMKMKQKLSRGE